MGNIFEKEKCTNTNIVSNTKDITNIIDNANNNFTALPIAEWTDIYASTFMVRHHISKEGCMIKNPSDSSIFKLIGVYKSTSKIPDKNIGFIMENKNVINDSDFVFAIQFMIPNRSYILYFKCDKSIITSDKLMNDFFINPSTTPEFRNGVFKLIPQIVEGNMMIKMAVRDTPCILGHKVKLDYYIDKNYFEIDIDTYSSSLSRNVIELVIRYASNIEVDIGFCLHKDLPETLPERLLGGCKFYKVDQINK